MPTRQNTRLAFHGQCRLGHDTPFVTDDTAAFDAHMAGHGRKLGSFAGERGGWTGHFRRDVLPPRMWKPPRPRRLDPTDWAGRDDVTLTLLDVAAA